MYPRESAKAFEERMEQQYAELVALGYGYERHMKNEYDRELERVFEGL